MKLEEIFTFENLYNAHKKCRKSKQYKGEVIRFEVNLSENIYKLMKEVVSKKYKVGTYKQFIIYEPKKRLIEALPYRDRLLLMCFCDNSLIPRIEKKLIYDNVACRKNKGTLFGMDRLEHFLKKEYFKEQNNRIYYLKCDIKKYFPSINHNILINKLKNAGFSEDELWFLIKVIKEQPNNITNGLPLGNQSSQWFALFYLDTIDRLVKEKLRIKSYIRYMDDFILLSKDKKYLQFCLEKISEVCEKELNLELNAKTQIGIASNGIDFLGFRHVLTNSGKVVRKMRLSSKKRLRRHLKTLNKLKSKKLIDDEYIDVRKNAYYAHLKYSNEEYFKGICQNKYNKVDRTKEKV